MAYKRYVHKKGKRHGPYYYKNVRDESGKVKSIYLGKASERGKKPLEVMIVFLIVLLIIISALFFIQNRNIVLSRISAEEAAVPFEIDQILIKVLVKADEHIGKELRVMNVGNEEKTIMVDTPGVSELVEVLDKEFKIKPGQTKIVRLNFSSFNSAEGIEQAPGVYIGKISAKTDSYEKEVPAVIEIESRNVLFDMNLNPVARDRSVLQGSSTTFEIRVFNLQSIESTSVDMEFFVKDTSGNTIISEKESVVVTTQASFFKTLKIPDKLKTGNYVFAAEASFGNSVGVASYLFEVEEAAKEEGAKLTKFIGFCRNDPLCWALSIVVLLLIFTIGAYSYFFIGVFIYKKMFEARAPKAKRTEETTIEKPLIVRKREERGIVTFFRNWNNKRKRAKELRLKKKLELEKQKLELREKKERLKLELEKKRNVLRAEKRKARRKKAFEFFHGLGLVKTEKEKKEYEEQKVLEKKEKLKIKLQKEEERQREKRLREREEETGIKKRIEKERERELRRGSAGKCKRLIDKGYRALDKNNLGRSERIYTKLMDAYINLPSERKAEIFKEINSFYKSLLLKKHQLRQKKEDEKRRGLEKKRYEESEAKKREEEKARKAKLIAEKRKARRKKAFEFFHGLGLVKTEKERKEYKKQREIEKQQKEIERKRLTEEKKKAEGEKIKARLEEKKQKELEDKRKEEEAKQRKIKEEKRLKELEVERKEAERKKGGIEEERKKEKEEQKKREEEIKAEEKRKEEEEKKKQKELEKKRKEEEKARKAKLIAEKRKARRKKVFEFFHGLGLVKTKKERKEYERKKVLEKKQKEAERKKLEEERKKRKIEEERQKELEAKRKEVGGKKEQMPTQKKEEGKSVEEIAKEIGELNKGFAGQETEWIRLKIGSGRQEEEKIRGKLDEKKQKDIEKRRKEDEKVRRAKLIEEKRKARRKKVFGFFHGLGLVKTKKERKEYERKKVLEKKQKEAERKKLEEERKKAEEKKEIKEFKGEDLEKSLKELGDFFEQRKKEKPGIIPKITGKKAKQPEVAKAKEIQKKLEGKSRKFVKCHKLLLKAKEALQNNNKGKAMRIYTKAREKYTKMDYMEKKEMYDELMKLYNKLGKQLKN
ncbi:hypothetical protein KY347_01545 [Candidatus Woesearchaeota archaeon]|nr:hypothetical protein [Candidatus Woesearchaeota archaeon]